MVLGGCFLPFLHFGEFFAEAGSFVEDHADLEPFIEVVIFCQHREKLQGHHVLRRLVFTKQVLAGLAACWKRGGGSPSCPPAAGPAPSPTRPTTHVHFLWFLANVAGGCASPTSSPPALLKIPWLTPRSFGKTQVFQSERSPLGWGKGTRKDIPGVFERRVEVGFAREGT